MKAFFKIIVSAMFFLFLLSTTSCLVLTPNKHHENGRHDHGRHRGWFKNHRDHRSMKGQDDQRQAQINGQESGNLVTVANYFDWSPETTLKTGRN